MTFPTGAMKISYSQLTLYPIPKFPVNNRFMMVFDTDHFFFTAVVFFNMGQIIRCDRFLLNQIAYIFFIPLNFYNMGITPFTIARITLNSGFP